MHDRMRIGDLTEQAGVTQRTVRYYESIGLLHPAEREGHGHHYYTEETLARLRKIDQLKRLGLSLDEIREVIDSRGPIPLKDVNLFMETASQVELQTPLAHLLHTILSTAEN